MRGTVIEDNEFYEANCSVIETAAGFSDLVIRNNCIYENGGASPISPELKFGNGILMIRGASDKEGCDGYGLVDGLIENNEIYSNQENGIYLGPNKKNVTIREKEINNNSKNAVIVDLIGNYWNPDFDETSGPFTCLAGSQNISVSFNKI